MGRYDEKRSNSKGLAIASLVLGIVGLILSFFLGFGIWIAVVGLVLGIVAAVKKQGGMAVAGIVCSIIAIVVAGIWMAFFSTVGTAVDQVVKETLPSSEQTESKVYGLGDVVEIKNGNGDVLYTITINSVTKTDYRNEYETSQPVEVIEVNYTYANVANDTDLMINYTDFEVVDETGAVASTYPINNTEFPQLISQGTNYTTIGGYGLQNPSTNVKINYTPLFSTEKVAEWNIQL